MQQAISKFGEGGGEMCGCGCEMCGVGVWPKSDFKYCVNTVQNKFTDLASNLITLKLMTSF